VADNNTTHPWHHHAVAIGVIGVAAITAIYFHTIVRFLFWAPLALMFLFFDWIGRP
jgi:hypothetical protein